MAEIGYPTDAIVADLATSQITSTTLQRAASLPASQAIRILTNALQNPDPQVRCTALQCILRKEATPEMALAIPAVAQCTKDPDTEVQAEAIRTLAALEPEPFTTDTPEK